MKLLVYRLKKALGDYRVGAFVEERVIDLNEAYRQLLLHQGEIDLVRNINSLLPTNISDYYSLGEVAFERSKEAIDFTMRNGLTKGVYDKEEVELAPPIPKGSKIICVGKNYKDHVMEMKSDIPDFPVLFNKFSNAIIGAEDSIQKSVYTEKLDYEGELTIVIGKEASHVRKEEALHYILGYTIGNDISARDLQKRTPQWLQGKSLDHSSPIGPWVVTGDEIQNPANLSIKTFVNGELRQNSNTEHLIFNIPFLIEFVSRLITLEPGDVILTGTPDGVGFGMEPPQYLQAGDTVKVEIEKIGTLENKVVDEKKSIR
ncbi:acylpyruvate hydrolase [Salirhabdus euzebyi]|uniref:Acylpyruvate hydrolase n=1 Tax=Salirhabdus euzebyi TaxID=394506 RepID=A0A841Q5U5_9BACI|nr:fumarylacetoacetate hydrolase family protein [Salirhabdus euzebyi]MBB6453780.1 acylpyruvate hydrolase [Salirhabdus euzebyi]